ncbi:PR-1-like protein, partial [Suhomyces tanzawaensis NRRL Y-17324]
ATSTRTTSAAPSSTGGASNIYNDGEFNNAILREHNIKRALHGVPSLAWDDSLATFAHDYAARAFSCDNVQLIHSNGPYGENLAAGYVGGADPVDAWYDEIKDYNYNNPVFAEETGHFTQVVWKGTTKVGCARVQCNNIWRQYTICEYSETRGNIVGTDPRTGKSFFSENVLPLI